MRKCIALLLVLVFLTASCIISIKPVWAPPENSWTTKAPMPTARHSLGVAVVNGKIYAIGGKNDGSYLATNEEYDPATNTWVTKKPMPTPRSEFGIAVYQNKIYVMGGEPTNGLNEVYDPATDTWETKTSMPTPRQYLDANVVNGKIYLIGGYASGGYTGVNEVYNPATDSWTTKTPSPYINRSSTSAVVDNKIYSIGLRSDDPNPWLWTAFVQIYDPVNDRWSIRADSPTVVYYADAGVTSGVNAPKRIYFFQSNSTQIYDPATDTWTTGPSMPTPRAGVGVAVVDDTLYVVGGLISIPADIFSMPDTYKPQAANEQYTPFLFGTVPAVSIVSPENLTYASTEVPLNFTVREATSWMGYSLDRQANVTITANTTLTDLSEGAHGLTVYAKNVAGDVTSSATVYFTVDLSPPSVAVLSPENKTYGPTNVQLAFTVDEKVSWTGYSLDSQANITVSGNATLPELSYGPHNLTVYAKDTVGHIGASETIHFTITQQEPLPTTWIVIAIVIIAVGGVILLVYFVKVKKTARKSGIVPELPR